MGKKLSLATCGHWISALIWLGNSLYHFNKGDGATGSLYLSLAVMFFAVGNMYLK